MALVSNVPQIVFTEDGLVVPTDDEILNGELQDFNTAFGGNLSLDLSTPQGQLSTSISAVISDKDSEFAYFVNQINPENSEGLFQDAIGYIYFIVRKPPIATLVIVDVTGLSGTVIPAGTLARDTSGNLYSCVSTITIDMSGTATGEFKNVKTGAIPCPANTLNIVYQSITGWDSINNPDDGILGKPVEGRADFEYRRKQSVMINATGVVPAIRGNVLAILEINDCFVVDNPNNITITIGTVSLVPHSVYVCAYSPIWTFDLEHNVAQAIWDKKDLGCNYNGDTTVTIQDVDFDYDVTFQKAIEIQIYFLINITNNPNLPNNIAQLIKQAISDNFREKIGSLIEANKYYGIILSVNPLVQIQSAFVGNIPSPATVSYKVEINQMPLCSPNNIIVNLV